MVIAQEFGLFETPDPSSLRGALNATVAAEALLAPERARLQAQIDKATDPKEITAREYQYDLVGWQINQFVDVANWRLDHLLTLQTEDDWDLEDQQCMSDSLEWTDPWGEQRTTPGIVYWFDMWCWSYDPRGIVKTLPFYLFPFQEGALLAIQRAVFEDRGSLLVDKSRDMGVTWLISGWNVYHWRYTPGFASLMGNRTEDEVDDSEGDMGATFNKLRFIVRLLPPQMHPSGFNEKRHMTYMTLTNPENKANISGSAPVEDFARGDRRTAIFPDEFASWKQSKGYKQYQSACQTSWCLIITSTVKGIFNKYGELLLDPEMPKCICDWHDHPWKDQRWYDSLTTKFLGAPMTATDIAQEVDRDPYASQPGQVLSQWGEVHNIITESEFWSVYGKVRPNDRPVAFNEFRIPLPGWNVSAGQDVGTTPEHPNVTSWLTRPRQTDPYPGFIFAVGEMVRVGLSTRQIAEGVFDEAGHVLTDGLMQRERAQFSGNRVVQRIISHEATTEMLGYQRDCEKYKTYWSKWPGDATGGIEQWANAIQIDPTKKNPFVIDPRTLDPKETFKKFVPMHDCGICHSRHLGEHLQGCASWFMVVPDEEGKLFVNDSGQLQRLPAKTERGFALGRLEIPGWHYPESEKGKEVKARKPQKGVDDYCDSVRMQMATFCLTSAPISDEEKIEAAIPANLKPEVIAELPPAEKDIAEQARYFAFHEAKRRIESTKRGNGVYQTSASKYNRRTDL